MLHMSIAKMFIGVLVGKRVLGPEAWGNIVKGNLWQTCLLRRTFIFLERKLEDVIWSTAQMPVSGS